MSIRARLPTTGGRTQTPWGSSGSLGFMKYCCHHQEDSEFKINSLEKQKGCRGNLGLQFLEAISLLWKAPLHPLAPAKKTGQEAEIKA